MSQNASSIKMGIVGMVLSMAFTAIMLGWNFSLFETKKQKKRGEKKAGDNKNRIRSIDKRTKKKNEQNTG